MKKETDAMTDEELAAEIEARKAAKSKPTGLAGRVVAAVRAQGSALRKWRGSHYLWDRERGCYLPATVDEVDKLIYRTLDSVFKSSEVSDVTRALVSVDGVLINGTDLGTWIAGSELPVDLALCDPLDLVVCPNGLLNLSTGTLHANTPEFFATGSLGAAYDPTAECPRWMRFLDEVLPDDAEAQLALQQWSGYLLAPDVRQHKIAGLIGDKRCGKGTVARTLTNVLGRENTCSPTLAQLSGNFGCSPLIGRLAAIIGDARLDGRKLAETTERLLSISGGDQQTIDRKHIAAWIGYLSARITLLSNELPRFEDASGAIATRFLVIPFSQTFLGREDFELTDKLARELSGILNWAIAGWRSLRAAGRFTIPRSSADLVEQLTDSASPMTAWIRQMCIVETGAVMPTEDAHRSFGTWAVLGGITATTHRIEFGRKIAAALPAGCRVGRTVVSGRQVPAIFGIRLATPTLTLAG